uniref:G-protein coupled receptors family 1 profile domain-containing protein n=1 Tax=Oreochromis niloticus TaxID=8128 RepID=A0A669D3V0_ORENI
DKKTKYKILYFLSLFRQLHTPTNLLLLSLAVADFCVGLLLFFQIVLIDGCWFLGDIMCTLYQYLAYVITSASIGTMVIICVDRYLAICYPLHYSTKITQQRVKIVVCLCWICSVIFQSLILMDNLKQPGRYNSCIGECVFVINYIAGLVDVTFSFIVPITVIVVLYLRVFVVAVSQARAMRSQLAVTHQRSVTVTAKKSELKAAWTLGIVVVVFLICMCPYYCVALTGQDSLPSSLIVKDNLKQPGKYNSCIGECVFVVNYIAGLFDLLFSFIVPITVIIVLYLRVFAVAVSQAHAMRCQHAVTHQRAVTVTVTKSELKAARTLGVVVVVFLICMCPYYCVALTEHFLKPYP